MVAAEPKTDGNNMKRLLPVFIYIHSLWIFFALSIINTFNPDFCNATYFLYIDIVKAIKLNLVPLFCVLFLVIGHCYELLFNFDMLGSYSKPRKISSIENITHENSMSYLTSNIIPLLSLGTAGMRELSLTALIVIITGCVFIKTDMYYLNPTLTLLGYKIYRLKREDDKQELIVMACKYFKQGDNIKVRNIKDNIYVGELVK